MTERAKAGDRAKPAGAGVGQSKNEAGPAARSLCGATQKRPLTCDYDPQLEQEFPKEECYRGSLCSRCKYVVDNIDDLGFGKVVRHPVKPFYEEPYPKYFWQMVQRDAELNEVIRYLNDNRPLKARL
jgi:hypothetical protein